MQKQAQLGEQRGLGEPIKPAGAGMGNPCKTVQKKLFLQAVYEYTPCKNSISWRKTAQMSRLAPLSPSSMLYVLYVLYGPQPASPPGPCYMCYMC